MPETKEQQMPTQTPTYRHCVKMLGELAKERSEWAGLPMLVNGYDLVVEPKFPYQFKVCRESDVSENTPDEELVNSWWCDRLMAEILVARRNGKLEHFIDYRGRGGQRGRALMDDLMCSSVWLIEAELKAMQKLEAMISTHLFNAYVMTGSFLETSKRSKITYLFRRLRPTVAISTSSGHANILCCLCLHPIGFYRGTHCGVMVPTDGVIAHLVMMRGSEEKFWAQSNQHPPNHPNACL